MSSVSKFIYDLFVDIIKRFLYLSFLSRWSWSIYISFAGVISAVFSAKFGTVPFYTSIIFVILVIFLNPRKRIRSLIDLREEAKRR